MLVSISRRLAYLAMPKTGTQSLERVLTPLCDIRYGGLPRVKHMTLQTFERFVRPYLEALGAGDTETLCVIREPVDWLGSWYRYRGRAALDGHPNSTRDVSFAEFVEAYLRRPTPPFARVGRISRFVAGASGGPGVTHMFRYENLAGHYTRSKLPGVGISIGLTRLFFQLKDAGIVDTAASSVDALVALLDDAGLDHALGLSQRLRAAGLNAFEREAEQLRGARGAQAASEFAFGAVSEGFEVESHVSRL